MERHKVIIAELLLSLDDDLKRTECLSRLEGLWLEKLRLIEMLKSTIRSKESTLCDFVQWTADAKQRMAVIDRRLVDVERQTLKCPRGQVFEHKSEDPTTMNFTGQWKTRISDLTDQLQHQRACGHSIYQIDHEKPHHWRAQGTREVVETGSEVHVERT